jgi:hypothetical protein
MDSRERKSKNIGSQKARVFSRHFSLANFFLLPEIFPSQKIYFLAPSVQSKRLYMNDFKIVFALPYAMRVSITILFRLED